MHREGFEPSRPFGPGHLGAGCLPISAPALARFLSWVSIVTLFHIFIEIEVGMTGFEPATSCIPSTRSHQAELHPEFLNYLINL